MTLNRAITNAFRHIPFTGRIGRKSMRRAKYWVGVAQKHWKLNQRAKDCELIVNLYR